MWALAAIRFANLRKGTLAACVLSWISFVIRIETYTFRLKQIKPTKRIPKTFIIAVPSPTSLNIEPKICDEDDGTAAADKSAIFWHFSEIVLVFRLVAFCGSILLVGSRYPSWIWSIIMLMSFASDHNYMYVICYSGIKRCATCVVAGLRFSMGNALLRRLNIYRANFGWNPRAYVMRENCIIISFELWASWIFIRNKSRWRNVVRCFFGFMLHLRHARQL